MLQPRRHHYLPRFYLRRFSADGDGLFQIEKRTGKAYGGNINDLGAERDFHKIDADDVADPYFFEKELAAIESIQAEVLADVLSGGLICEEVRLEFVAFLSMMRMRVPSMKSKIKDFYGSAVLSSTKIHQRQGQLPTVPIGYEKTLAVDRLKVDVFNWKCLEVMYGTAANPRFLSTLYGMRPTLYFAPFGAAFVTSDQPVALFHPSKSVASRGVGPETPGVELSFPLSTRCLLTLDHRQGGYRERHATIDQVLEFNRRTIVMAERFVFAGTPHTKAVEQVVRWGSRDTISEVEILDYGKGIINQIRFKGVTIPDG